MTLLGEREGFATAGEVPNRSDAGLVTWFTKAAAQNVKLVRTRWNWNATTRRGSTNNRRLMRYATERGLLMMWTPGGSGGAFVPPATPDPYGDACQALAWEMRLVKRFSATTHGPRGACRSATGATLPAHTATATTLTASANGAIGTVGGVALALNDRLLVRHGPGAEQGIYTVTAVGSAGAPWVLTRASDASTSAQLTKADRYDWEPAVRVTAGTFATDEFHQLNPVPTVGTSAQSWLLVPVPAGGAEGRPQSWWLDTDAYGGSVCNPRADYLVQIETWNEANAFFWHVGGQSNYRPTEADRRLYWEMHKDGYVKVRGDNGADPSAHFATSGIAHCNRSLGPPGQGTPGWVFDQNVDNVAYRYYEKGLSHTTWGLYAGNKGWTHAATTSALPANSRAGNVLTATANGALPAIDGVTLAVGHQLLVKNEATGAHNGIYDVTDLGSAGTPWVLTRSSNADTSGEFKVANADGTGATWVTVAGGTTNGPRTLKAGRYQSPSTERQRFGLTTAGSITLNTTALTWARTDAPYFDGWGIHIYVHAATPVGGYDNADAGPDLVVGVNAQSYNDKPTEWSFIRFYNLTHFLAVIAGITETQRANITESGYASIPAAGGVSFAFQAANEWLYAWHWAQSGPGGRGHMTRTHYKFSLENVSDETTETDHESGVGLFNYRSATEKLAAAPFRQHMLDVLPVIVGEPDYSIVRSVEVTGASGTTVAATLPGAGTPAAGNKLVFVVESFIAGMTATDTPATGVTKVDDGTTEGQAQATATDCGIYYHDCDGSEGNTWTLTMSVSGSKKLFLMEVEGLAAGQPELVGAKSSSVADTEVTGIGAFAAVSDVSLVLFAIQAAGDPTVPPGFTPHATTPGILLGATQLQNHGNADAILTRQAGAGEGFGGAVEWTTPRTYAAVMVAWPVAGEVTTTPVGKALTSKWTKRTLVGRTRTARWVKRTQVGKALISLWDQSAPAGPTQVGKALTSKWNQQVQVGSDLTARWSIRTQVGQDLTGRWFIASPVYLVGRTVTGLWHVHQLTGRPLTARWGTRGFPQTALLLYGRLPAAYREADMRLGQPLLAFLHSMGGQLAELELLLDRIRYVPRDQGGPEGSTSDLTDPWTADAAWLAWLAQAAGVRLRDLDVLAQRHAIAAGSGVSVGSKRAIAAAARTALVGSGTVVVRDHINVDPYVITVSTRPSETPDAAAVLAAVAGAGQKPAGHALEHGFVTANWRLWHAIPTWREFQAIPTWSVLMGGA